MRYLLLFAIALFTCSFMVRDKVIREGGRYRLYIYPNETDTNSYLEQILYDAASSREIFYLHGINCRQIDVSKINGQYSVDENIRNEEKHTLFFSGSYHTQYFESRVRKFIISNTMHLDVSYDVNAKITSYTVTTVDRSFGNFTAVHVDWDSAYEFKWEGAFIFPQDTIVFKDSTTGQETTMISTHENVKSGWWKKYNDKNEVIDSIYYPDPKH